MPLMNECCNDDLIDLDPLRSQSLFHIGVTEGRGRTAPGDTLQGVGRRGDTQPKIIFVGEFRKNTG